MLNASWLSRGDEPHILCSREVCTEGLTSAAENSSPLYQAVWRLSAAASHFISSARLYWAQLRELHLVDVAVRGGGLGPLLAHMLRNLLVSLCLAHVPVLGARIVNHPVRLAEPCAQLHVCRI